MAAECATELSTGWMRPCTCVTPMPGGVDHRRCVGAEEGLTHAETNAATCQGLTRRDVYAATPQAVIV